MSKGILMLLLSTLGHYRAKLWLHVFPVDGCHVVSAYRTKHSLPWIVMGVPFGESSRTSTFPSMLIALPEGYSLIE